MVLKDGGEIMVNRKTIWEKILPLDDIDHYVSNKEEFIKLFDKGKIKKGDSILYVEQSDASSTEVKK